ncbi:hypothetical protein THRCLA_02598 [Thraustotheca clavata]|uniref:Uncharacterized protein n=1 Tax=Thraustotheca clavata TaxID=74557 RepID=A0A1W0A4K9_9STRA|nr:hypothetical protein THRCLA_02598 [Thraustotheca clavata]
MDQLHVTLGCTIDQLDDKKQVENGAYSYMFAQSLDGYWNSIEKRSNERVLMAVLRRHCQNLLVEGTVEKDGMMQLHVVRFVNGKYQGKALNVQAFPSAVIALRDTKYRCQTLVFARLLLNTMGELIAEVVSNVSVPKDQLIQMWTPGCSFGGFTFPMDLPLPSVRSFKSINALLAQDPTRHNLYAFDGMLQTYQLPAVTSYIVRPQLYNDDSLSYKTLSIQQMQAWAIDRRHQAQKYRQENKLSLAIQEYTAAIELDPQDAETYYDRAMVYFGLKQSQEAKNDLHQVLQLNPSHAMAKHKLEQVEIVPDRDRLLHLLQDELKQRKKDKKKRKKETKSHRRDQKFKKSMRREDQVGLAAMAARVDERNNHETNAFTALISSYQQLMLSQQYLVAQNQKLHQLHVPPSPTRLVAQKEEQLVKLQSTVYEMEAVAKERELEMVAFRDELTRQRLRAELAEQDNEELHKRIRELEQQLMQKSKLMEEFLLADSEPMAKAPLLHDEIPMENNSNVSLQHGKNIRAHATEVNSVCFNGSGKIVFSASSDGTVRAWDAHSCQAKADYRGLGMSQPLICVRVSEDGELVLGTGCDRICQVWRVGTCRIAHTLLGHKGKVYAAEFMLERSNEVLTGGADRSIRVWDVQSGNNLKAFSCRSTCNDIAVGLGGQFASAHQDGAVRFWDSRTKAPIHELSDFHADQITSVSYSQDGNKLLTNSRDNTLKLLDPRTYGVLGNYKAPSYTCGFNWSKATLSPDGLHIAAGSTSGSVLIWDAMTEHVLHENKEMHTGAVVGCMWSPNGSMLASCDKNGCLVLWE